VLRETYVIGCTRHCVLRHTRHPCRRSPWTGQAAGQRSRI